MPGVRWLQGYHVQYGVESGQHPAPMLQYGKSHLPASLWKKQIFSFPRKVRETHTEAHTVLGLSSPMLE